MDVHGVVERGRKMGLREGRTSTTLVSSSRVKRAWGMTKVVTLEPGDVIANMGVVQACAPHTAQQMTVWTGGDWTQRELDKETEVYAFSVANKK